MVIRLYKKSYLALFVAPYKIEYDDGEIFVTPAYFNNIIVNDNKRIIIDGVVIGTIVSPRQQL